MRAYDCPCGQHLEADDDEGLVAASREHIDQSHPGMVPGRGNPTRLFRLNPSVEHLKDIVRARGYDAQAAATGQPQ